MSQQPSEEEARERNTANTMESDQWKAQGSGCTISSCNRPFNSRISRQLETMAENRTGCSPSGNSPLN
ncbi:Hypothetical predicted protein [Podarcis lilfordi]|uniref:Uncharacterized protein n=1 Tax=Podarcis lilfordi TaxID=74358 RepID=A0AA35JVR5_9SAUR|nr:Hypothetical predicted protein [Podarcis lilfordi]